MKPLGRVLPLLCVLFAAFAVPTGAAAKPGSVFGVGSRHAEAHLTGTHGYRITIQASRGSFTLMAKKGTGWVTYFAFGGRLKGDRIEAPLPGVGRVSLRFHEHSRPHDGSARACHGSGPRVRTGVFVGLVKIKGERGYTRAESRHVRGKIVERSKSSCHRPTVASVSSASFDSISARTSRGRGYLSFTAFSFPSTRLETNFVFVASLVRIRGAMGIVTSQGAVSEDPATMEIAAPPRSATVDPPTPFTGSATFQQEGTNQFSWTGDLEAELPGIGEVSLAGPKFETELCRGRRCKGDDEKATASALAGFTAAAPTPSPWRWPGSPR